MSIENLLTLGVAVGLLVAGALLRLLVLGGLRLFAKLLGREIPADVPDGEAPTSRRPRPIARPALHGLDALGRGLVHALATLGTWLATLGTWLAPAGTFVGRAATRAHASLSPRVRSGSQTVLASSGRGLKTAMIVTVASVQHLVRLATAWTKQRAEERSHARATLHAPAEEPAEARVIRLDREWDPLTDPLEDEPASNYR